MEGGREEYQHISIRIYIYLSTEDSKERGLQEVKQMAISAVKDDKSADIGEDGGIGVIGVIRGGRESVAATRLTVMWKRYSLQRRSV
jgi:hypothetical protein